MNHSHWQERIAGKNKSDIGNEPDDQTDRPRSFWHGGRRIYFVHPLEPEKCIKVLRIDDKRTIPVKKKRLMPAELRRNHNNNDHEQQILATLHKQIGTKISAHLPICHGTQLRTVNEDNNS